MLTVALYKYQASHDVSCGGGGKTVVKKPLSLDDDDDCQNGNLIAINLS